MDIEETMQCLLAKMDASKKEAEAYREDIKEIKYGQEETRKEIRSGQEEMRKEIKFGQAEMRAINKSGLSDLKTMNVPAVTDKRKKLSRRIEDTDSRYSFVQPGRKRRNSRHNGPENNGSNTVCHMNVPIVTDKRKKSTRRLEDTDNRKSFAQPGKKRRNRRHNGPVRNSSNIDDYHLLGDDTVWLL
jgi:hypothetical protein